MRKFNACNDSYAKHHGLLFGSNRRHDNLPMAVRNEQSTISNERRRHIAWLYRRELEETPLVLPFEAPWAYHVYHLYVVRTKDRDELRKYLNEKHVSTLIHYPTPIHLQKVYKHLGYKKGSFPKAEEVTNEIISLPMYPSLKQDEVLYVCRCIREFFGK